MSNRNKLSLLFIFWPFLIISWSSYADPIKLKASKGEAIEIPISAARQSKTLADLLDDLGEEVSKETEIPLSALSKATLKAIVSALKLLDEEAQKGRAVSAHKAREIVQKSLPLRATHDDVVLFLKAVNHLDIKALEKAATFLFFYFAFRMDFRGDLKEGPLKDFFSGIGPKEYTLTPLLKDYIVKSGLKDLILKEEDLKESLNYLHDPTSLIKIDKPIIFGSRPGALISVKNKLFVALPLADAIKVLDLDDSTYGTRANIDLGRLGWPDAFALAGIKLFVARSSDITISEIDATNNRVESSSILVGKIPAALAVTGNRLFVANSGDNTISVIDTTNNSLVGSPISVGERPIYLAVAGNKLFVANSSEDTISVIDTTNNSVVGSPISVGKRPIYLAVAGNKLFVANHMDSTISVIDTANNSVVGSPIPVGRGPTALAIAGNMLFVENADTSISIIDTMNNQVVGSDLQLNATSAYALVVVQNKLFVSTYKGLFVLDLEKYLYYVSND